MNKIILADNQTVFRAGTAHALSAGEENRIVAQCETAEQLLYAVENFPGSIVLFASAMLHGPAALDDVTSRATAADSRTILITENGETAPQEMLLKVDGAIARNISGAELVECIRNVAHGQRSIVRAGGDAAQLLDTVGARVRDRLTPKEMQIVALVVQGCKNREIAEKLDTKEQVIKNYLRSVYDKTGVSDRLELALFTVHHRILAEAAAKAGHLIQQKQSV
ncbi:MAG TPA: response regulator transcription factor [Acidobacteriaceae bacterium]|nr:response regulator transcription factor [Acidobacteriaceae bacterium]